MSNLKLNIPITFEAGAALQIKEDITQSVQNSYGMLTTFNQSATGFNAFVSKLGETKSGLTITENDITLLAETTYIKGPSGTTTRFFTTQNGQASIDTGFLQAIQVTANSLHTTGTDTGNSIDIANGEIKCNGSQSGSSIVFGINDDGYAVLDFKKNNNVLYSLGPEGLLSADFNDVANSYETKILYNTKDIKLHSTPAYGNFFLYFDLSGQMMLQSLQNYAYSLTIIPSHDYNPTIIYQFKSGYKSVGQAIQYYDTKTANVPSYNNKLYKCNTSDLNKLTGYDSTSISFKNNSDNYADGVYIDGTIELVDDYINNDEFQFAGGYACYKDYPKYDDGSTSQNLSTLANIVSQNGIYKQKIITIQNGEIINDNKYIYYSFLLKNPVISDGTVANFNTAMQASDGIYKNTGCEYKALCDNNTGHKLYAPYTGTSPYNNHNKNPQIQKDLSLYDILFDDTNFNGYLTFSNQS